MMLILLFTVANPSSPTKELNKSIEEKGVEDGTTKPPEATTVILKEVVKEAGFVVGSLGRRGHGLQISQSGLLQERVLDWDLVPAGIAGLYCHWHDVPEACVRVRHLWRHHHHIHLYPRIRSLQLCRRTKVAVVHVFKKRRRMQVYWGNGSGLSAPLIIEEASIGILDDYYYCELSNILPQNP